MEEWLNKLFKSTRTLSIKDTRAQDARTLKNERQREYRRNNLEAVTNAQKRYNEANAEHIKQRGMKYRKDNAEHIKAYKRAYYKANADIIEFLKVMKTYKGGNNN